MTDLSFPAINLSVADLSDRLITDIRRTETLRTDGLRSLVNLDVLAAIIVADYLCAVVGSLFSVQFASLCVQFA